MSIVQTFGNSWSRALCVGCARLGVLPEWVLKMIALESAGTWDVNVLQGRASLVPASGPDDTRDEVSGHFGLRLSHGTGARGFLQHMPIRTKREGQPDLLILYAPSDPVVQLNDGVRGWAELAERNRTTFRSLAALYCANLAPARLIGGEYDDETIVYSANPVDEALNRRGGRWTKTYWPAAYRANAEPFGLDPKDGQGRLLMKHLPIGLERAVRATQKRYDAELGAAYVVNVTGA